MPETWTARDIQKKYQLSTRKLRLVEAILIIQLAPGGRVFGKTNTITDELLKEFVSHTRLIPIEDNVTNS